MKDLFAPDPKPPAQKPGDGVTLSPGQDEAAKRVLAPQGRVSILTGPAGCGKSTIINHLRETVPCTIAATTGKAAMHIDGCTVDSLFCFNRDNYRVWNEDFLTYVMREAADLIIIDEASMIGKRMANLIYEIAVAHKKRLLLVGDWAQARPVKDDWITNSKMMADYDLIKLTECHRQSEGPYLEALNDVRLGHISEATEALFKSRVGLKPPEGSHVIRAFATNAKADAFNQANLWRLVALGGATAFRLFATYHDARDPKKQADKPRDEGYKLDAIEATNFAHGEPFALGCRVVCTYNEPEFKSYVNGDTGDLIGGSCQDGRSLQSALEAFAKNETPFRIEALQIKLDRGPVVLVRTLEREKKDALDRVQDVITGFPLRLGYGITIHKSQGMTVQAAQVDLESLLAFPDKESRHGLAYVALSRTKTLEGLYLRNWAPEAIFCDPEIRGFL
jgi:ATP-dependent exoDNAse (exonuclease V) alpha subunit